MDVCVHAVAMDINTKQSFFIITRGANVRWLTLQVQNQKEKMC